MRGCLQLRRYWMFINITIITVLELSMKEIGKGGWEQERGARTFTDGINYCDSLQQRCPCEVVQLGLYM